MRTVLTGLAAEAPVARVSSDELWKLGRTRRRGRKVVAAALVLLVIAVGALPFDSPRQPLSPADHPTMLPGQVSTPHLWQRTHAEAPNGPVLAAFSARRGSVSVIGSRPGFLPDLVLGSATTVLLGRDGSYRLRRGVSEHLLSPDGRYLAGNGELVDLETGATERIPGDHALAWSADGAQLFLADGRSGVIDYDPLGRRTIITYPQEDVTAAAFSPDGSLVACQLELPGGQHWLVVLDLARGTLLYDIAIPDGWELAGPAAWDGPDRLALFEYQPGGRWAVLTVAAGQPGMTVLERFQPASDPDLAPQRIHGWRDGRPVLSVHNAQTDTVSIVQLERSGALVTLMTTDSGWVQIPQNLIAEATFGGPTAAPPLFEPANWFWWTVTAVLLLIVLLGTVRRGLRPGCVEGRRRKTDVVAELGNSDVATATSTLPSFNTTPNFPQRR